MKITNIDYNFIKAQLKTLESAYKQSNDKEVLSSVQTRIYFNLVEKIDGFEKNFSEHFESFKMSNLKEIDELSEAILESMNIIHLPEVSEPDLKKKIKLSDRDLASLIRGYNEAVKTPLTYYSQKIDEKLAILYYEDNIFTSVICNTIKNKKAIIPSFCHFCNTLRKGDEIVFIANTKSTHKDYSTLGVYCCLDYRACNKEITNKDNLIKFINYKGKKK